MKKRRPSPRKRISLLLAGFFFLCASPSFGQATAPAPSRRVASSTTGGVFLVFPFENAGASPRLDWIGEGLEELTIQELSAVGQQVYTHEGRLDEMDRAGLPANAKLSRATMLHIAQEMDADYVLFGSFASDGTTLKVSGHVLRVNPAALLPALSESAPLPSLMDLEHRLVWRLLTATDRTYPLTLAEFSKLQRPLQLGAFEQYTRGLLASDDAVRLRDLKEAARLEPEWPNPAFALGQLYFSRNECGQALNWFARVPPTHERSAEAVFSTGICFLRINQPEKAERAFNSLQEDLKRNMVSGAELPEVMNNLALARARQGNVAAALTPLGRARDLDPDQDDYPFNLGLLSLQGNDLVTAAGHFREAIEREPDNPEDWAFLVYALEKSGKKSEAEQERSLAQESLGPDGIPALKLDSRPDALTKYQRVSRELDTTTLRLELAGPQAQNADLAASGGPADAGVAHIRRGRQELAAGRLDSAESEFRAALAADPKNAFAHRELADIDRRRGKLDDAVRELQVSLASRDSASTRVTLARIYLEQKKPDLARAEVEKAVKLAPNYSEARELLDHLRKSRPTGGAQ